MPENPTEAPVKPLEEGAQTDPAVVEPTGAPAPEVAPEKPPEEAEAGVKVEPSAWKDVTEVEGLREHVQPLLEESEQKGYDRRSGEYDQYAQPYLQQHSQRLNDINAGVGRMLKDLGVITKVAKNGEVDVDALTEWSDSHEETLRALVGEYRTPWEYHGGKRVMVSIAEAAGDKNLADDFVRQNGRVDMLASQVPDPNLFSDFVKKVTTKAVADVKTPLETEITSLKAANEELKRRVTKGPDITPKGGGGTEDDNALLLDPNTPTEKLKEIRARQQLAG